MNYYKLSIVPFILLILISCDRYDLIHTNPFDSESENFHTADLTVSNVSFSPQTINVGANPTAISFRITNNGPWSLEDPNTHMVGQFYVSKNTIFGDGDDLQIGINGYNFDLLSKTSIDVGLSPMGLSYLTIPKGAGGVSYIFVHIQHGTTSVFVDPNPANDYAILAGTINVISSK